MLDLDKIQELVLDLDNNPIENRGLPSDDFSSLKNSEIIGDVIIFLP